MHRFFGFNFLLITCSFILGGGSSACCQTNKQATIVNDTLKSVINVALNGNHSKLFVHYDKNVYLPNETIWFTAYRLGDDSSQPSPEVLAVALIKNSDHTIAAHKKFVVTGIASSGNIMVPDSVITGDYTLMAYTNRFTNGKPEELFIQPVTIKRLDPLLSTIKPVANQPAPSPPTGIDIKFYPEGGELVAGLSTIVGWESKDKSGRPVSIKAVLYQDGQFADTIATSASGMGKFFIKPKAGSTYEVKITGDETSPVALPAIANQGVALTMSKAIVQDTLVFKVAGNTGKVHIVVHNTRKIFYAIKNADPQAFKLYKIALDSLPRGLAEVTIYNQAMQICAERVFFAHYDTPPAISIKPDQGVYGKRKEVKLTLDFNSAVSKQGVVSIACVRTNRIDRKNFNDIESFAYLGRSINSFANDRKYIEDLLLIRGWRKYLTEDSLADTSTRFGGFVTVRGKPAKKPVVLVFFKDTGSMPVLTDNAGQFTIAANDLVTNNPKRLTLMTAGQATYYTQINYIDPYVKINSAIAHALKFDDRGLFFKNGNPALNQSALDNNIILKQVTIKSRRDDEFDVMPHRYITNKCGDYVCVSGILNCMATGHNVNAKIPIVGHKYQRPTGGFETYLGCLVENKSTIHPEGIALRKEYYPYNDTDITLSEPLYENTLYWKDQLNIKKNKPTTLSFYTGDIKAGFTVIVQGVADNEVVFGEQHFEIE